MAFKKCMACLTPIQSGFLCEEHKAALDGGMRQISGLTDTTKLRAEALARYDAHVANLKAGKKP